MTSVHHLIIPNVYHWQLTFFPFDLSILIVWLVNLHQCFDSFELLHQVCMRMPRRNHSGQCYCHWQKQFSSPTTKHGIYHWLVGKRQARGKSVELLEVGTDDGRCRTTHCRLQNGQATNPRRTSFVLAAAFWSERRSRRWSRRGHGSLRLAHAFLPPCGTGPGERYLSV